MLHPLMKTLVVHGFAFSMGLGGAMLISRGFQSSPQPSQSVPMLMPERTQRADRAEASVRLSSSSSFRTAYSILVESSMTGSERSACMQKLWEHWGEADPVGMLAFLESKRVWPKDFYLSGTSRPDLLLDFALRNGSSDTLRSLGYADPLIVARLLAEIPKEKRGSELITLAKETDRKLGRLGIAMENPSPAYLRGVAETLLEQGRIDEFLRAFKEIEDSTEKDDLARKFGDELTAETPGDEVLEWVLSLPEPYHHDAAYRLMGNGNRLAMEYPEVREVHKRQIKSFAEAGLVEAAASGVSILFGEEHAAKRGEEMADWIANFPADGSWKPITDEVFRYWSDSDREGMIEQISALPASPVRETLAMLAAEVTIGGRVDSYNERQQMIHDLLSQLFIDPNARRKFDERFAPVSEETGDFDPFAPQEDPFAE